MSMFIHSLAPLLDIHCTLTISYMNPRQALIVYRLIDASFIIKFPIIPSYFKIETFVKCCSWSTLCSKGLIRIFRETLTVAYRTWPAQQKKCVYRMFSTPIHYPANVCTTTTIPCLIYVFYLYFNNPTAFVFRMKLYLNTGNAACKQLRFSTGIYSCWSEISSAIFYKNHPTDCLQNTNIFILQWHLN